MRYLRYVLLGLLALAALVLGAGPGAASPSTTERVSVASDGTEANGSSSEASMSADGRYVAFSSQASNLGAVGVGVFVHDRQTGETTLVSVASDGTAAGGDQPSISADGRFVAFRSGASNIVPNDTNGSLDIFIYDRQTGDTTRVSVASDGSEAYACNFPVYLPPAPPCLFEISGDGRHIVFRSNSPDLVADAAGEGVFVHDRQTGQTARLSLINHSASISFDGRYVAVGDGSVHDRDADADGIFDEPGAIAVEEEASGSQPSISADGRYVAFVSGAINLVPNDTNSAGDVFVHDRQTGQTTRVSVASDGTEGNDQSSQPSMSADGRFVTFPSFASNLVAGDTNNFCDNNFDGTFADNCPDIFVHDRQTGATTRVSVASDGTQGNNHSGVFSTPFSKPSLSADGRFVAFDSFASNLVTGDTNEFTDVFVHDRGPAAPAPESVSEAAAAGGTVTSDTEADGATASDPIETTVTTPNAGTVSIEETSITEPTPTGFQLLGQQVNISAPASTPDNPLVIVFRIDSSRIPPGEDETTIQLFKDGVLVPGCTGAPGTAVPDPCVSSRAMLGDGDVEIAVLTSSASAWNFGVVLDSDGDGFPDSVDGCPGTPTVWPTPIGDDDCDGTTTALENFLGTNPNLACGINAWPPDTTDNGMVNTFDFLLMLNSWQLSTGEEGYIQRADLNGNGTVNTFDFLPVLAVWQMSCT